MAGPAFQPTSVCQDQICLLYGWTGLPRREKNRAEPSVGGRERRRLEKAPQNRLPGKRSMGAKEKLGPDSRAEQGGW